MIRSSDTFNFGKHRGLKVMDVARVEPGYIYFCENEIGVRFTSRVKRQCLNTSSRKRAARQGNTPLFY